MDIIKYLEEAIKLEENTSRLYQLFAEHYKDDYIFWWRLSLEELNHSALLKTGIEFAEQNEFPKELIPDNIDEIIQLNDSFDSLIENFKSNPTRYKCFEIALNIESSAGENHFQEVMTNHSDNEIVQIFQKLNKDDINHYNRIKDYFGKII